jgi:phosphatidylglycerol:prolipoprotein diacylglycerol transferase
MLTYPEIDPVAIALGPLKIHWYGLMYLVGFAGAWWLMRLRARRPGSGWSPEQVDDLLFYGAVGVVAGGRVGYMLFYDFGALLHNPLSLFFVWQGGMSFHGGLLGVLLAVWFFCRREKRSWLATMDFAAPVVPVGLAAGRIGNFINGELWGKVTDVPWAMVFPTGGPLPRHPSQLYEALFEGVALWLLMWLLVRKRKAFPGFAVGCYAIGYGLARFVIEYFREPDAGLGYVLALGDPGAPAYRYAGPLNFSMGQVFSAAMILGGILVLAIAPALKRRGLLAAGEAARGTLSAGQAGPAGPGSPAGAAKARAAEARKRRKRIK